MSPWYMTRDGNSPQKRRNTPGRTSAWDGRGRHRSRQELIPAPGATGQQKRERQAGQEHAIAFLEQCAHMYSSGHGQWVGGRLRLLDVQTRILVSGRSGNGAAGGELGGHGGDGWRRTGEQQSGISRWHSAAKNMERAEAVGYRDATIITTRKSGSGHTPQAHLCQSRNLCCSRKFNTPAALCSWL